MYLGDAFVYSGCCRGRGSELFFLDTAMADGDTEHGGGGGAVGVGGGVGVGWGGGGGGGEGGGGGGGGGVLAGVWRPSKSVFTERS